jgi:hypothetical protein
VRKFSAFSGILLIALLAAPLPGSVFAAPMSEAASPPSSGEAKPSEQAIPSKVKITPHRAIYTMSLASVKNGSNITGVSGRMLFEWSDVCDGWAVQQHLQLHFSYAQGDESDVTSTVISWESKDGKRYNFNVRRVSDGKETDLFRGKAVMGDDGGLVTYTVPKDKTTKLTADTIFPSAHTEMLIRKAEAGEKLFTRRVFDGSDEEGISDISAFIGTQQAGPLQAAEVSPKLKNNPLLEPAAWPVRMAFFKIDTETGEPDYEMNLTLLSNGVARDMQLDYGDFSVSGTLTDIEPLPAAECRG